MADYTDPTGSIVGTDGNDTFTFTTVPTFTGFVDGAGSTDTLTVNIPSAPAETFSVAEDNPGSFYALFSVLYVAQITAFHVENVNFTGSANNDNFHLQLGSTTAGLSANFDGGAGVDSLDFDW